jgi:autotransporter-associated beta strand protein
MSFITFVRQMVHWRRLVFTGAVFALTMVAQIACSAPPAGYYLVWADEFSGSSLDTTKWNYWLAGVRRDAVNTSSAVSVGGGNLTITTYTSNSTHYTGMIATDNKFRTKFGYWEASIDWNDAPGMWSAYWMQSPTMGADISDPVTSGSEIDIAEHRSIDSSSNNIADKVQANIHWNGYGASHVSQGSGNVGTGLNTGFHTYGFKWTSGSYDFTIDGVSKWTGGSSPVSRSTEWMILSSEVDDGSWAGNIPAGGYGNLGTSTTKMTVDYVRYYAPTNTLFWTGTGSAFWTNSANWISNKTPVAASDLTFSYLSTGNLSNFLGANLSVDSLTVLETTSAFSLNGTNALTLGAGGVDMISLSKDAAFNCPITMGAAQTWTIGSGRKLIVNSNLSGSGVLTKAGKGTLAIGASNVIGKSILVTAGDALLNSGSSNQFAFLATGAGAITVMMGPSPARCLNVNLTNANLNFTFGTVSNLFGAGLVVPTLNLIGSNAVNITGLNLPLTNITLLTYTTKAGGGSFYLGSLPAGTEATLNDTGSALVLNVISWPQVLTWHGSASGTWNTNGLTLDWDGGSAAYQQYGTTADSVVFDDSAADFSVALSQPVSPASVTVDNETNAYTFSSPGRITGTTTFVKRGTNTVTINTSNTFSGNITISDGKVALGSGAGFYQKTGGTKLTVNNGGVLSVVGNLGYDRGVFGYLAAQATGLVLDGGTLQHTGSSNLKTNDGAGRLLTIGAGGATLDSATAGQTFYLGYRYDYSTSLTSSSGGSLELTGAGNGDLNYIFPGTGALLKTGTGTWSLTANNTFTGSTTISAGVMNIQFSGALGGTANGTTVEDNARLELQGGITVAGEPLSITGKGGSSFFNGALNSKSGSNTWTGPVTIAADNTRIGAEAGATLMVSGVISDGSETNSLVIRSADATGTVMLSGANTYHGNTWVVAGNLKLNGGNDRLPYGGKLILGGVGNVTCDLNGWSQTVSGLTTNASTTCVVTNSSVTLATFTVNTPTGSPSTYAGRISGNLALTKTGPDTLTLYGANTHSGATLVNAGTLVVSGSLIGLGVTATSGGVLAGTGTISSPVTVQTNAVLDPGVGGVGLVTLSSTLNLQSGSLTRVDINKLSGTNDVVVVGGAVTYGGTLLVTNVGGTLTAGDSFVLFNVAGSKSGNFTNLVIDPPPAGLNATFNPTNGTLTFAPAVVASPTLSFTSVGGGILQFSWTGSFKLQSQTNTLGVGLRTNWFDVPGGNASPVNVTNDASQGSLFFRLSSP